MYTSIVFTVLAGIAAPTPDVSWSADYSAARQLGQSEKKPLAVFLGSGEKGHEKVCRDGNLSKAAQEKLKNNYVCVYVDMGTPAGKRLANAFEITQPAGIILSDRSGDTQAYYHNGPLSGDDLSRALARFADPNLAVRSTVTDLNAPQMSFYPPVQSGAVGGTEGYPTRMSFYPPLQGGFGSPGGFGGCPGGT